MKEKVEVFVNYIKTGVSIHGRRLENGDVLQKDDVYNSSSGFWEKCPCPGPVLQSSNDIVIWVRPEY